MGNDFTKNDLLTMLGSVLSEDNLKELFLQRMNLDKGIPGTVPPSMKGEDIDMGRQKVQASLPNGEKVWITGDTKTELVNNALAKYGQCNRPGGVNVFFGPYATEQIDTFLSKKWKPSTLKTNEFLMEKHILPYFGDMAISNINVATLQKFFDQKKDLSKSYTKQMKILLHQVFAYAEEDNIITTDPTESKKLTLPDKVTKREALTIGNLQEIISELVKLEQEDALFLAMLIYTGMRRGEVLGLKWENVDIDAGVIHVRSEAVYKGNTAMFNEYTKSAAGERDINIAEELKPYLTNGGEGFVIGGGKKPITQSKLARMWQRINKRIDLHGATPHTFRHTYASLMAATNEIDYKTIQKTLGHADFAFTYNRYIHPVEENMKEVPQKVSEFLKKIDKKGNTGEGASAP